LAKFFFYEVYIHIYLFINSWGRRGCDGMVVGHTTTYANSVYYR